MPKKFNLKVYGLKVKKIRNKREITQRKLASLVNVTETTIYNIENSKTFYNIKLELLWKIADILEVPIDELVGRPIKKFQKQ
jgi:transcriptional regulator with XRE-family HTH domain